MPDTHTAHTLLQIRDFPGAVEVAWGWKVVLSVDQAAQSALKYTVMWGKSLLCAVWSSQMLTVQLVDLCVRSGCEVRSPRSAGRDFLDAAPQVQGRKKWMKSEWQQGALQLRQETTFHWIISYHLFFFSKCQPHVWVERRLERMCRSKVCADLESFLCTPQRREQFLTEW